MKTRTWENDPDTEVAKIPALAMTTRQAAAALGIGERTMRDLLVSGQIKSVKIGKSRRVAASHLQEYLDRQAAA